MEKIFSLTLEISLFRTKTVLRFENLIYLRKKGSQNKLSTFPYQPITRLVYLFVTLLHYVLYKKDMW